MAISLVQKVGHAISSGATNTVTITSTTQHNLLIAVMMSDAGIDTFSMPAGWTQVDSVVTNGDKTLALYYYKDNPGGITSVACGRGQSLFSFTATIAEYSGVDLSSPLDQHATKTGASGTSLTTTSITTTVADELLIVACANDATNFTAVTSGWTIQNVSTDSGEASGYADRIVSATGAYSPTVTSNGGGKWATINASFKAAPVPYQPVNSTAIVAATGGSRTNHMFYAANTARWWNFYLSAATTISAQYSTDGGQTWTTCAQTIALGQSINGWAFGVAYANISSTDVVHIAVNAINTSDSAKHFRTTLSTTNIASPSSITIGTSFYQFFDGPVTISPNFHVLEMFLQGGDWYGEAWPNADAGSSWTPGTASSGPGAGNNFYVVGAIAATGNTAAIVVLDDSNAGTATSPDSSASWGPTWGKWTGSAWSDQGSISGTSAVTQKYNNFGLVARTTSDVHFVRRTSSTAFEHKRYNGTSWSSGDSIPAQGSVDGGGIALATDGTSVYAFCIDSGAGNNIMVSTWVSGTGWSSWTAVTASSATRANVTVSQTADGSGNWLVAWLDGSSSPWAIKVAVFTPGGGGGATLEGEALLAGAGALAASAVVTFVGSSTLSASLSQAATGARTLQVGAELAADLDLGASALRGVSGSAALSGDLDLIVAAVRSYLASAALSGDLSMDATAARLLNGAASLSGELTLTAAAAGRILVAAAALAAEGNLSASANLTLAASSALSAGMSLDAQANLALAAQAALDASLDLEASGIISGGTGHANLRASLALLASASVNRSSGAALSGKASLAASAAMRRSATAVLTGALELDATPLRRVGGSAALSGEMDMAVQAALTMAGRAVMTAGMDVNVLASLIMVGAAALEGSLSLSTEAASGTFIPLLATVLLQAALTASAQFDAPTTATVEFEQSLEGSVE